MEEEDKKMEINKVQSEMAMGGMTTLSPMKVQPDTQHTSQSYEVSKRVGQSTNISFDKVANVFVMKFIDKNSKEVIQQVPAQAMIEFAKSVNQMQGLVLNTTA